MGNYSRNDLHPSTALKRLASANSKHIRFLAASGRRSGNLLAEGRNCLESDIEDLAESVLGLNCVARRTEHIRLGLLGIQELRGYDTARRALRLGTRLLRVTVTFVAGASQLPDARALRSANPRVRFALSESKDLTAVVSVYDRPSSGGNMGEPDDAVQRALRQHDVAFRTTTTRSVRTLMELMAVADELGSTFPPSSVGE